MRAEYLNPFIGAVTSVFNTMLNCQISRGAIFLKNGQDPSHEISGIIGLSGRASGTVVLSLNRQTALSAAQTMLGEAQTEINADVKDVVGELANMVAGSAKAQLAQFDMSLTIPTVVTGNFHVVFPSKTPPICIPFETPWGSLTVEVGLVETP